MASQSNVRRLCRSAFERAYFIHCLIEGTIPSNLEYEKPVMIMLPVLLGLASIVTISLRRCQFNPVEPSQISRFSWIFSSKAMGQA